MAKLYLNMIYLNKNKFPVISDMIKQNYSMFGFKHFQTILDKTTDYTLLHCMCFTLQTKKHLHFMTNYPPRPPIQC